MGTRGRGVAFALVMGAVVPLAKGAPSREPAANREAQPSLANTQKISVQVPSAEETRSRARGKKADYIRSKQIEEQEPHRFVARGPFFSESFEPAPPKNANRVINIYNKWTNEFVVVDAATADALEVDANTFFRCHFTGEPTEVDPRLVRNLVRAARHFNVKRVNVVSGYRAPKYNLILRKKGRQVARESQHTQGNAIDFRLPGVPARKLYKWVKRQQLGGVGFYAKSQFIHMDTGPIRTWTGR